MIPLTFEESETMNKTAISAGNPAAVCPSWCHADHRNEKLVPDEHGCWNVLHLSPATDVETAEALPPDAVVELSVQMQHYVSETDNDPAELMLWLRANSAYWGERPVDFNLTARQALRLAEVLVQQAAAVLAEQTMTTAAAR